MKKFLFILLIIFITLVFGGCGNGSDQDFISVPAGTISPTPDNTQKIHEPIMPDIPPYDEYNVQLIIDPAGQTVDGISQITFTNRTGEPLEEIVFRLFFNAFSEGHIPRPFFEEREEIIFRQFYREYGYINVQYALINNEVIEHSIEGTVLRLYLSNPLPPDTTARITLQYSSFIPKISHRTGANEHAMWFGMFLPSLALFDENGWRVDEYYPAGDPFMSNTANYQIEVITPVRYVVVGSGHRSEEVIGETDSKITRFTAHQARDFTFALSYRFNHIQSTSTSGIEINLYYFSSGLDIDMIMNAARQSMDFFERRVGAFPFSHITIVETELATHSASFSQIIFLDTDPIREDNFAGLVHGIGNQWFTNIVGIDSVNYPWLDEGLTRFVQQGLFFPTPEELHDRMQRERDTISHRTDLYMTKSLSEFTTWNSFVFTHGRKAMLMFYSLQQYMGYDNFWLLISRYYQDFSFGMAEGSDFFSLAEEIHGESLQDFIDLWINSGDVPELPDF